MINVFGEFLFFGKRNVVDTNIHVIDLGKKVKYIVRSECVTYKRKSP